MCPPLVIMEIDNKVFIASLLLIPASIILFFSGLPLPISGASLIFLAFFQFHMILALAFMGNVQELELKSIDIHEIILDWAWLLIPITFVLLFLFLPEPVFWLLVMIGTPLIGMFWLCYELKLRYRFRIKGSEVIATLFRVEEQPYPWIRYTIGGKEYKARCRYQIFEAGDQINILVHNKNPYDFVYSEQVSVMWPLIVPTLMIIFGTAFLLLLWPVLF